MNDRPSLLLARLDAIAASLARNSHALALIALGSVGAELHRLDDYSDLDFFAVVQPEHKQAFISDLTWLANVASFAFSFQNTLDGCKVLFEDGVYAEFAVFDPQDIARVSLAEGRIVWQREGIHLTTSTAASPAAPGTVERLTGEVLTNLYVGLLRLKRGERLSAQRLIQGHAVDRVLELCLHIEQPVPLNEDRYDNTRRFELRFPHAAQDLPHFVQGYDRVTESALAILEFMERHFSVNQALAERIRELL